MSEVIKYEVPKIYDYMIKEITRLGRSHYKVALKRGYCYQESAAHSYIIDNYALFRSFGKIDTCVCNECILSMSDRLPGVVRSAVTMST